MLSFDANEILLKTSQGMLAIKGKELHVSRLQLELGRLTWKAVLTVSCTLRAWIRSRRRKPS